MVAAAVAAAAAEEQELVVMLVMVPEKEQRLLSRVRAREKARVGCLLRYPHCVSLTRFSCRKLRRHPPRPLMRPEEAEVSRHQDSIFIQSAGLAPRPSLRVRVRDFDRLRVGDSCVQACTAPAARSGTVELEAPRARRRGGARARARRQEFELNSWP